jgi:hypothetical protein
MMKKLLTLLVFIPAAAFAQPQAFKYKTPCILDSQGVVTTDLCTVVETREDSGALRTRNIFSNKFRLTVKSRFDKVLGFRTWDNFNNFEYSYPYKVKKFDGIEETYTEVSPGLSLESVSWD